MTMGILSFLGVPQNDFQKPGLLYHFLTRPLHFSLTYIHALLVQLRKKPIKADKKKIRVVCISDSHTYISTIPEGDVVIHAGDLTNAGSVVEIQRQLDWLDKLEHQHIVVIAGNHDSYFDSRSRKPEDADKKLDFKRIEYLQHSGITLNFPDRDGRTLRIHGAPQIPECGGREHAFQYRRSDDAWSNTLPSDIDILVTHTPPRWHLDLPWGMGCDYLLKEVWRIRPELHVFGHIHDGQGQQIVYWDEAQASFERVMSSQGYFDILNPFIWLDCIRVIVFDIIGIIWTRIWGAESQSTLMVNSAVADFYGRLRHSPQVVEI